MPFSRSMFSSASIISEFIAVPASLRECSCVLRDFVRFGSRAPLEHRARLGDVARTRCARSCRRRACRSKPASSAAAMHAADAPRPAVGVATSPRPSRPARRAKCAGVRSGRSSPGLLTSSMYGPGSPRRAAGRRASGDTAWVASAIASRSTPPSRSTMTRRMRARPAAAHLDVVEVEAELGDGGRQGPHDHVDVDHVDAPAFQ